MVLASLTKRLSRTFRLAASTRPATFGDSRSSKQPGVNHVPSIQDLPGEILLEIFIYTTPTPDLPYPPDDPLTLTSLHLSQVSRSWRNIALYTPILWSNICIYARETALERSLLPKLSMWLHRSRHCLLDIRVRLLALDEEIGRRIFERLVRHSKKWRSVDFAVPHHCDEEFDHKKLLESLNVPMELPSLRWVSLRRFQEPPVCFSYAPNLEQIQIQLSFLDGGTGAARIFYHSEAMRHVRAVTIGNAPSGLVDIIEYLKGQSRILSFTVETERRLGRLRPTVAFVPNLVHLHLKWSCNILRFLDCPALESLHLTSSPAQDDLTASGHPFPLTGINELPSFLARSPSLKYLRIDPMTSLLWLLDPRAAACSLEHLELSFFGGRRGVCALPDFHQHHRLRVTLPCLRTVSLKFPNWDITAKWPLRLVEGLIWHLPMLRNIGGGMTISTVFPALEKLQVEVGLQELRKFTVGWKRDWVKLKRRVPASGTLDMKFFRYIRGQRVEDLSEEPELSPDPFQQAAVAEPTLKRSASLKRMSRRFSSILERSHSMPEVPTLPRDTKVERRFSKRLSAGIISLVS
ncbi:hypothetical protein DL96DRAFT_1564562 [Flagelloscypha sp. PMI_526]|nr:hypothetical protein DL96DRAFT_1564562 [Flagelloscypha sp. PMI_526]